MASSWIVSRAGRDGSKRYLVRYRLGGRDLAFRIYTAPEPSSLVLLGLGGAAVAWVASRRRAK
ncbi:MAG TPA: PEP-CTERM sorting domain-containing protein [Pirellulales bacterium]|nr:PEP-CTERM sorting domain-containing protein [Pirellulales bacterium]